MAGLSHITRIMCICEYIYVLGKAEINKVAGLCCIGNCPYINILIKAYNHSRINAI